MTSSNQNNATLQASSMYNKRGSSYDVEKKSAYDLDEKRGFSYDDAKRAMYDLDLGSWFLRWKISQSMCHLNSAFW